MDRDRLRFRNGGVLPQTWTRTGPHCQQLNPLFFEGSRKLGRLLDSHRRIDVGHPAWVDTSPSVLGKRSPGIPSKTKRPGAMFCPCLCCFVSTEWILATCVFASASRAGQWKEFISRANSSYAETEATPTLASVLSLCSLALDQPFYGCLQKIREPTGGLGKSP